MLTDIEIAQNADMKPITEIAHSLGIDNDDIEPYGHYKAKLFQFHVFWQQFYRVLQKRISSHSRRYFPY